MTRFGCMVMYTSEAYVCAAIPGCVPYGWGEDNITLPRGTNAMLFVWRGPSQLCA